MLGEQGSRALPARGIVAAVGETGEPQEVVGSPLGGLGAGRCLMGRAGVAAHDLDVGAQARPARVAVHPRDRELRVRELEPHARDVSGDESRQSRMMLAHDRECGRVAGAHALLQRSRLALQVLEAGVAGETMGRHVVPPLGNAWRPQVRRKEVHRTSTFSDQVGLALPADRMRPARTPMLLHLRGCMNGRSIRR